MFADPGFWYEAVEKGAGADSEYDPFPDSAYASLGCNSGMTLDSSLSQQDIIFR
jgi:NAD/NADP transhydrogenase alpha subunit